MRALHRQIGAGSVAGRQHFEGLAALAVQVFKGAAVIAVREADARRLLAHVDDKEIAVRVQHDVAQAIRSRLRQAAQNVQAQRAPVHLLAGQPRRDRPGPETGHAGEGEVHRALAVVDLDLVRLAHPVFNQRAEHGMREGEALPDGRAAAILDVDVRGPLLLRHADRCALRAADHHDFARARQVVALLRGVAQHAVARACAAVQRDLVPCSRPPPQCPRRRTSTASADTRRSGPPSARTAAPCPRHEASAPRSGDRPRRR